MHLISDLAAMMFITGAISLICVLVGSTSLAAVDCAMCSASVVLKVISPWRQLHHVVGQLSCMIT
eukprot:12513114-Ditylum_brightwellii.AAC.1